MLKQRLLRQTPSPRPNSLVRSRSSHQVKLCLGVNDACECLDILHAMADCSPHYQDSLVVFPRRWLVRGATALYADGDAVSVCFIGSCAWTWRGELRPVPCGAGEQAAEDAAEAMQLRRKLLLLERRKAATQRTAAMLAERGLTLPPDLPRTPRTVRPLQPKAAAAAASGQRLTRSRFSGAMDAAAAAPPGPLNDASGVHKRAHSPLQRVGDPPAKRRRTEFDPQTAAQLDVTGAEDATSPATTEVQADDSGSTDPDAHLATSSVMQPVGNQDLVSAGAAASRKAAFGHTAHDDHPHATSAERNEPIPGGGVNGSLAVTASPRQEVSTPADRPPSAAAQPAAVSRSSEKLLAALIAAEAAPAVLNVKARAGPILAVSRALTGFGDIAAKVPSFLYTGVRSKTNAHYCIPPYHMPIRLTVLDASASGLIPALVLQATGDDADTPLFGTIAKRGPALGLRLATAAPDGDPAIQPASESPAEAQGPYRSLLLCFRSYRCCRGPQLPRHACLLGYLSYRDRCRSSLLCLTGGGHSQNMRSMTVLGSEWVVTCLLALFSQSAFETGGTARRLCETFATLGGGQLAGPSFAHALDPQWPLCAFEHAPRGACHDAACAAQMTVDYWLPPKLALDNVVKLAARSDQRFAS